jgi:hypothetical protein
MHERVELRFPDRAAQARERHELSRLDNVEGFIWAKALQFSSNDLMLTEDLAQEAREAVIRRLREDPDCPTGHLKVKARDAVYRYRGRGSSVDGKLYPINRIKTYQISSLDIFWLRDESLEDTANLPDPDVLALEIIEDLQAALEQFAEIAEDLGEQ